MQARETLLSFAFAWFAFTGCGTSLPYVWVEQLPKAEIAEGSREYVIAAGDTLTVRVYNQDGVTTRVRVRPDGRFAVPLAGEVEAEGRRPVDLAREIEAKLKPFLVAPAVAVGVDEVQPARVSVLGEVARPGVYPVESRGGVLDAVAAAGGLTEFADRDRIFLVRKRPGRPPLRVRFTFAQLTGGSARAAAFTVAPGDVVAVE
jgi:polysaccharide export outer membrane protein